MDAEHKKKRIPPKAVRVYASDDELQQIAVNAAAVSMSQSAYLKALGLGYKPASVYDRDVVIQLVKINADQGRLGGLIKMWLSNDERLALYDHDQLAKSIFGVLEKIDELQGEMLEIVKSRRILAAKKIG